jgi:hypothetical protein
MSAEIDALQRVARRIDPPVVQVMTNLVEDQEIVVAAAVRGELAARDIPDIAPIGAEIQPLQRVAGRIDPPIVQVMIDGVADQKIGPAVGRELAGPDEADIGPSGAEIDPCSLKLESIHQSYK